MGPGKLSLVGAYSVSVPSSSAAIAVGRSENRNDPVISESSYGVGGFGWERDMRIEPMRCSRL